jgi:hypothetical protein
LTQAKASVNACSASTAPTSVTTGLWEIGQMLVFPKTRRPRGGTIEEELDFAP